MNFLQEKQKKDRIDLRLKVTHKKNSIIPVHMCETQNRFSVKQEDKKAETGKYTFF